MRFLRPTFGFAATAARFVKPAAYTAAALTGTAVAAGTVGAIALGTIAYRALRTRKLAPGSVVVVTGGSRGLGLAIADRFAKDPVRLVLASRKREELEEAQAKLLASHPHLKPEDFYLCPCDLSHRAECERLISEAIGRFGRIDILVNNAGIIEVGPIEAQTVEAFERAMQVNFMAAMYTTMAALPHLQKQDALDGSSHRASIVNIASIGGKMAVPHMLPYTAAKFALVGFSEGLHAEVRRHGIRVTTVCPGLMRTGGEAHAQFVGDVEAEKKWFNLAANAPLISVSSGHAANRIYAATLSGRAEITISPQAWLMARGTGLFPETVQFANAMVNEYILPKAPASASEK